MGDQLTNRKKEFLGSGWSFPVTFSIGDHKLILTRYEKNISDSIDVIIQTKFGERPLVPEFGSGLQRFFFKKMDETLKGEIKNTIESALLDNEPRITVLNVDVFFTDIEKGLIEIKIGYEYNQTNTRHNYVYPFYIKEGTNLGK